ARAAHGEALRSVEDFEILAPLTLPAEGATVQTQLGAAADGALSFSVHSRAGEGAWRQHASGRLRPLTPEQARAGADITGFTATQDALGASQPGAAFYG